MATIAIDYDDTFTADMALWSGFMRAAQEAGHAVICVTAREDNARDRGQIEQTFEVWDCVVPVTFTNRGSKLEAMAAAGVGVDIWIDNDPVTLVSGQP